MIGSRGDVGAVSSRAVQEALSRGRWRGWRRRVRRWLPLVLRSASPGDEHVGQRERGEDCRSRECGHQQVRALGVIGVDGPQ